jgi:hypothetical protein
VYEGPPAAGSTTGLAAVKLDGHKYVPVAVAAGNTIKVSRPSRQGLAGGIAAHSMHITVSNGRWCLHETAHCCR